MKIVVLLFLALLSMPIANAYPDLIAFYPFNGNVQDESGNGYNGTVHGASTVLTTDRFGNPNSAYEMTDNYGPYGGGNWIEIPQMIGGLTNLTISMWVNEYEIGYIHAEDYISFGSDNSGDGSWVRISHQKLANDLQFRATAGAGTFAFQYDYDDDWNHGFQHYALVYNGVEGLLQGYVNGNLFGEIYTTPGPLEIYPDKAGLGVHWWDNGDIMSTRFNGIIDDVAIYSHALTGDEVQAIYNAPNPVPEPTTLILLGTGLIGLAGYKRKHQ